MKKNAKTLKELIHIKEKVAREEAFNDFLVGLTIGDLKALRTKVARALRALNAYDNGEVIK